MNGVISILAVTKTAKEEAVLKSISARHMHFLLDGLHQLCFLNQFFWQRDSILEKNAQYQLTFLPQKLNRKHSRALYCVYSTVS